MNWKESKTWVVVAVVIVAAFAIYSFASSSESTSRINDATTTEAPRRTAAGQQTRITPPAGVELVRTDLLNQQISSPRSGRNLFDFVQPPPPPIVVPKAIIEKPLPPPPPPPDRDADGAPDMSDNCPDVPNPDQGDIDRNGIGTACQQTKEYPPPPELPYDYIGNFGTAARPFAAFRHKSNKEELINVRPGQTFGGSFILRGIGIESVDIGYVGYPPDFKKRVPLGQ